MTDNHLPASFPDLLAGHLAKLNQQLRLLLAANQVPESGSTAQPGPAHSVLSRLRVAANLLVDPQLFSGAYRESWNHLGVSLGELASGLRDVPDRLPAHLLSPLVQLADFLGESFSRLDEGEDADALGNDPRWEALLGTFINAGTVLQVLDDMEDRMQVWSRRFDDQDLSASQEEALQLRWAMLRQYGDSLFGEAQSLMVGSNDPPQVSRLLAGRCVMLLLDSPFRRAQLSDNLREAGCTVELAHTPAEVLARVEDPLPPDLLLCDNLEPSLHLVVVRGQLETLAPSLRLPLVLVATTGGSVNGLRDRARLLGAQLTWAEPFRLEDLAGVFG